MRPMHSDLRSRALPLNQRGFTLLEMIVAITLFGILAVVTIPLLQLPMSAYADANRRADLGAQLDMAATKMKADLARAVPGSIRIAGPFSGTYYLEYMEQRAVGRYRTASAGAACPPTPCTGGNNRDQLEPTGDNCVGTLGALTGATPVPNSDQVVINPMGNTSPWTGNRSTLQAATFSSATFMGCVRMAASPFTPSAVNQHLYVASMPVTYECNTATGRLTRYWGYAFPAMPAGTQRTNFNGVASALVATNITACQFERPTVPNPPFQPKPVRVGSGNLVTVSMDMGQQTNGVLETVRVFFEFGEREVPK
jgi:prepilin-type N-terminal cleavage/methylation domain-containing protein